MKKIVLIILSFILISCAESSSGTYNPIVSPSPNPDINGKKTGKNIIVDYLMQMKAGNYLI